MTSKTKKENARRESGRENVKKRNPENKSKKCSLFSPLTKN
jgi:hypothetical protein